MAKKKLKRGIFITFEGPEGSGKSTHAKLIYQFLKGEGYDCVFTREPGGTIIGNKIRDVLLNPKYKLLEISPLCELLLFEAARAEIIDKVIAPNLKKKKIVVCDRFNDSTIVYQGYAGCLPLNNVIKADSYVTRKAKPDITIILDIDAKTGLKRAGSNKKADRMESKSLAFHKRVRNGFKDLARKNKNRIKLIKVRASIAETQSIVRKEITNVVQRYNRVC